MLEGKIACITGASSGIGRATAHLMTQYGAKVAIAARDAAALEEAANEIRKRGVEVHVVPGDVTDECARARISSRQLRITARCTSW